MSAWKLVARRLYALGGSVHSREIDDGTTRAGSVLGTLKSYGLVTRTGTNANSTWSLTKKGIDFCEGKIVFIRDGPYPGFFKATWLYAFPKDVSITKDALTAIL